MVKFLVESGIDSRRSNSDASIEIEINDVIEIIRIRHDIAHRNGKSKSGENIIIREADIAKMYVSIIIFSEKLQQQINAKIA
mgnify:CR=1 FL=1